MKSLIFPAAALFLCTGCAPELKQYFSHLPSVDGTILPTDTSTTPLGNSNSPVAGQIPSTTPSTLPSPIPEKTVCDPFGTTSPVVPATEVGHGLIASLKYLDDSMPRYTTVGDYQKYGLPVDANFYFFQLNVPTRYFTQGFQNQNGMSLSKPDGTILYEYFSLHYESQLLLPKGMGTKKYQMGVIADDGTVLRVNQGVGYTTWVNNDGTHPTRFACAKKALQLNDQQGLPITVDYYQGPRYNIALMLMIREWTDDTASGSSFNPNDPFCGAEGNDLFFDYQTIPSQPKANFQALLSRGWQVVPAEYFYLPGNPPPPNPCQ
jgi:hypothetical protein